MSILFLSSFEKLHETALSMKIGTKSTLNRHQVGTKPGLSRDQVVVQPPTKSPTQLSTQSDDSVQRLLLVLKDGEKSSGALRSVLGIKHRPTFRDNYLRPALDAELIEMTIPEKPSSSKQKYRLTAKGNALSATE